MGVVHSRVVISFRRPRPVSAILFAAVLATSTAHAAERELDEQPPPSSVAEIETPIQRVFPRLKMRPRIFPSLRQGLQKLPPFFADTQLEARFRTYYLRADGSTSPLREAWAVGGSIHYQSGWLADTFAVQAEGFTSQPVVAQDERFGTLLLEPIQDEISTLGIVNAKLRYGDYVLTGYRQYLDLPYLNRRDNRMIPNTFESLTLEKVDGELRFSGGYTWRVKLRSSDEFVSMSEAVGLDQKRGLAHAGLVWDPHDDFHIGAVAGVLPDVFAGAYGELGFSRDVTDEVEARLDAQFTYQSPIGDELLDSDLDESWNLGVRGSTSWRGAVFRLGGSLTSPDGSVRSFFGSSPSYVDLMQRSFNLPDEKALLASISYDFTGVGLGGITVIVNFVAGFDGRSSLGRRDTQELDVTLDYRPDEGFLQGVWLRVRGSFLADGEADTGGSDIRVIFRYDFPVL